MNHTQQPDVTTVVTLLTQMEAANQQRQAEADKRQAEADKRQAEANAALMSKLDNVESRLERIEQNTITIMGAVVTDFEGVSENSKQKIEKEGNDVNAAVVVDFAENPQFRRKVTRNKTTGRQTEKLVAVPSLKLTEYYNDIGATKAQRSAAGNWLGGILSKIFDTKFNSRYHESLRGLAEALLDYYFVERDSKRAY
jgi:hypothetical protein